MISIIILGIILAVFIAILILIYCEDYTNPENRRQGYLVKFIKKGEEKERRKTLRLKANLDMSYRPVEGKNTSNILQTQDVSVGGAQMILYEKLNKGTKIEVQIKLPFKPISVKAIAEIIWLREKLSFSLKQKKRIFFAGVKFIKINPPDEAKLLEYIHGILP